MRRPGFALLLLLLAPLPAPAREAPPAFPKPSRPVSAIVSPRWSDEESRERAGEAASVIALAGVRAGQTVADIGAGEGYYSLKLSAAVGPGGRVYAEDIVPRYLDALKARLRKAKSANVSVVLGAPDDPRLPPASVDQVFMVHMYHEVAQPFGLLWRLQPAFRAGGRLAIVDMDRATGDHGTPPALLACELAATGYRQTEFHVLKDAGGYLAIFEPPAQRPDPQTVRPCPAPPPQR